jgi:LCP family protein required for cell wall assembly
MTTAKDPATAGGDPGSTTAGASATADADAVAEQADVDPAPEADAAEHADTAGDTDAAADAAPTPDPAADAALTSDAAAADADPAADAAADPAADAAAAETTDTAADTVDIPDQDEAATTTEATADDDEADDDEADDDEAAGATAAADDAAVDDGAAGDEGGAVPPPRRRRRWVRVLTTITVVLVVLAGVAVGAAALLVRRYDNSVHQEPLLGAAAVPAPTVKQDDGRALIEGALNILLVGIDEQDDDPGAGARSDSIIILHINADHSKAYLLSIPRDTRVQLPAYPKSRYGGGTDKINAAFSIGWRNGGGRGGGFELLSLAVQKLTGLSFHAGGIVNFQGLTAVVDALGGVDMCVDEEVTSIHVGWDASGNLKAPYILMAPDFARAEKQPGVRAQVYHVGCQHFNGWQALDYVRQRELISDGDYGRQRHQQQLLSALAGKLTASGMLSDPIGTDKALRALGNSVTFDGNGVSLLDWIFTLKGLRPANLTMLKTNGGKFTTEMIGGRSYEATSETSMEMYTAAKNDTLDAFAAAHPDWVSK